MLKMRINLKPMKTIYTLLYILSITCCSFGQGVKLAKADKKYEKYAYIDAIEIYEKGMSVAKTAGDNHSLSELAGAKMNLED